MPVGCGKSAKRTRIKLGVAAEEGQAAHSANIDAARLVVVWKAVGRFACECALGARCKIHAPASNMVA